MNCRPRRCGSSKGTGSITAFALAGIGMVGALLIVIRSCDICEDILESTAGDDLRLGNRIIQQRSGRVAHFRLKCAELG
jgi:hypothetical protein